MIYPSLPAVIPACALRGEWMLAPVDPARRTEMDDGYVAVERRLSRLSGTQRLVWEMTGPALDLLIAFWADDLNGGTAWFTAPVIEGSRTELRLIRMTGGQPPWQATSVAGGVFRFAFDAEIRDLPLLSAAERMAVEQWLARDRDVTQLIADLTVITDRIEDLASWY